MISSAPAVPPAPTTNVKESSLLGDIASGAVNLGAGAVRGAGSIGATLLAPYDMAKDAIAGKGLSLESNRERRKGIDEGLQAMGADPESAMYGIGKFGGEMAGTLGTGGVLAKGAQALGAAPKVIQALQTWGMNTGASPVGIAQRVADVGLRAGAGGLVGGAAGTAINPEHAGMSAGIGAGAAAVLPPVFGGTARVAQLIKDAVKPTPGALGVRAAGDKVDDVIQALLTEKSNVPGVSLTAGQASVPANSAEFAALNKLVAQDRAPSRFFGSGGIKGQQEAARLDAVRGIGGTPDQLSAAIEARSAASGANYEAAFAMPIKSDKALVELSKNPFFKDELKDARKLVEASNAKRVSDGLPPRKSLTEFLQFVKEGLDAKIQQSSNPNAPAISNAAKNAAIDAKKKLVDWLGAQNPAYETARLAHSSASKPINQMKLGQELENSLSAPATGVERAASFASKVRAAETTVSKQSGRLRIEDLTSQQRSVIQAIEDDFARNANYKELAQLGSGTSLERRIGAATIPPTGLFSPIISAARSWANKALGTGHDNALERIAPFMEKPQDLARLMQAATPAQRNVINSMIEQYMSNAAIVGQQQGE